jgi:hypothetical protein
MTVARLERALAVEFGRSGNPYSAMAESVVAGLGLTGTGGGADGVDPVGVLTIAYDGIDCGPPEHLGCRLTEVIAGRPRAFAISGQGAAGPFTAMRIASMLVRTRAAARALVLLLAHGQEPTDADVAVGFVISGHGPVRLTRVTVAPVAKAPSPPGAGPGLAGWAELAGSVQRGTEFVLSQPEPGFGYRCELRVAP